MKTIITIGRQFGSGGHEIGRLLAKRLNIPCYDKDLIALAAKNSGMSPEIFSHVDETATSSFLYAITAGGYPSASYQAAGTLPLNDKLFIAQTEIIRSKAKEGPCVFVGRCADSVLKDVSPLLSVFVRADLPYRVERIMKRDQCSEKEATDRIIKDDKKRAKYYNFYTQKRWGAAESYDLVLNSAKLAPEAVVDVICAFAERMEQSENPAD